MAITEQDENNAERARSKYGVPVYANPEEMFDAANLDLVDIVVPPDGHLPLTALAAAKRVHVLVETPIAPTLAQADAMIEVCSSAGVQLEVAENVWRFPNELLKRAAIDAGFLGEVINLQLFYGSGSYHGMNAIHTHAGAGPSRVVGHAKFLKQRDDYDRLTGASPVMRSNAWEIGIFDFPTGATAVYQYPARVERGNYWEIIGTQASFVGSDYVPHGRGATPIPIEAELDGDTIVELSLAVSPELRWENPYAEYGVEGADGHALARIYMSIHAAATGAGVDYGAAAARLDQEMLIGVRESALQGGASVTFPIEEETTYEARILEEHEEKFGADALDTSPEAWRRLYPRKVLTRTYVG